MGSNNTTTGIYSPGLNHVGAYQASGFPYVYGNQNCTTPTEFKFPYVTRWIKVHNGGTNPVRIGFSGAGVVGDNFLTLPVGESTEALEIKTNTLWVFGGSGIDVMAGLTTIPASRMGELTGVGIDA